MFGRGVVDSILFGQGNGPVDEKLRRLEIPFKDQDAAQTVQCRIIVRVDEERLEEKAFGPLDQSICGRTARLDRCPVLQR